jgi:hypothetical protein
MSEAATSVHLEKVKEQAEAQQRRRAPPLAGHNSKRQKVNGQAAGDEEEEQEGAVSRFAYAAADAIAQGSTCLMASCGFNRQRSAAKELLSIVKPLLPGGRVWCAVLLLLLLLLLTQACDASVYWQLHCTTQHHMPICSTGTSSLSQCSVM